MTRRLVVVRPEPGASETVARARMLGVDAVASPLFMVAPVAWEVTPLDTYDALLLTSANAIRHGGTGLHALTTLPVLAVGGATAEAARLAGFTIEQTGVSGLADLLGEIPDSYRLLHLAGRDRTEFTAAQAIETIVVYASRAVAPPDPAVFAGEIVALHSPRAARYLASLMLDRSAIALVALSLAVASAAGSGWASVSIASTPTDDALLALAAELCLDAD